MAKATTKEQMQTFMRRTNDCISEVAELAGGAIEELAEINSIVISESQPQNTATWFEET